MFEIEIRRFDENGNLEDKSTMFAHEFKINVFAGDDDSEEMAYFDGVKDRAAGVYRVRGQGVDPWGDELVETLDIHPE